MGLLLDMYIKNLVWFHLCSYNSATSYEHVTSVRAIGVNMASLVPARPFFGGIVVDWLTTIIHIVE